MPNPTVNPHLDAAKPSPRRLPPCGLGLDPVTIKISRTPYKIVVRQYLVLAKIMYGRSTAAPHVRTM